MARARIAWLTVTLASFPAFAQTTRVSVDSTGAQANGPSSTASISADGRYVAFSSVASNLVGGDTNGFEDVFLRDLTAGITQLVSASVIGGPSDGASSNTDISPFGWLGFDSNATNLVAGDTNGARDAFMYRLGNGPVMVRVSKITFPAVVEANGASTKALGALGYFAVYESRASNLVAGDVNGAQDVIVDLGFWYVPHLASVSSSGAQSNADSFVCSVAWDGSILFRSSASNLVAGDTNGVEDVFSRYGNVTRRVSVGTGGIEANGPSSEGVEDRFGRWIAFTSRASNLVSNDSNGLPDVFVRDTLTNAVLCVSIGTNGAQGDGASSHPTISADGTLVAFYSEAADLVPNDTNGCGDVFVRDLQAGTTTRVSVGPSGIQGNGESGAKVVRITWDGRSLLFDSLASNLVAGDTNSSRDMFVHDRGLPVGTYCTACTSTHGCTASISGAGTPSASNSSAFTIHVLWVEGQKSGIVFYGVNGPIAAPWAPMWFGSTSYVCVRQPLQRTPTQSSAATSDTCLGAFSLDWNAYVTSHPTALGAPFTAGQHVFAQAWYRDPPAPKSIQFSNALEFVIAP